MGENPSRQPYVVALTGGIASGKSAVSAMFERLGVPVVDTDVIARELVEPGQPLLNSIVAAFGQQIVDALGRLKRRRLRKLIFRDPEKRARLEALMHPEIAAEATHRLAAVNAPYAILVIPLLAETGRLEGVNRVLVVDADSEIQVQRLMDRDQVSREQAERSLAAQASREQRLALADDVIVNHGSLEELEQQVAQLHLMYREIATEGSRG
ncbi:MAG: dephospho-CoA kinase [Xanthomonadales bacterium]|nr:dephospho-CoA kinase [Xanthomonadales bacterium]